MLIDIFHLPPGSFPPWFAIFCEINVIHISIRSIYEVCSCAASLVKIYCTIKCRGRGAKTNVRLVVTHGLNMSTHTSMTILHYQLPYHHYREKKCKMYTSLENIAEHLTIANVNILQSIFHLSFQCLFKMLLF